MGRQQHLVRCVAFAARFDEVRQLVGPFWRQESVPVKNIILPGLDGILSLAAALSFVVLGIRLLNQNLHLYRYSLGLLWIVFWSAFRLVVRFGQLPMAFRMPQRLLEVLLMTAQCLSFLEGSHILCNVIGQKSYRRALFSGHAATAIGLIWCICPLMAGDLSFSDLSQMHGLFTGMGNHSICQFLFLFLSLPQIQKHSPRCHEQRLEQITNRWSPKRKSY